MTSLTTGILLLSVFSAPVALGNSPAPLIEQQREVFLAVFESVERGDWRAVDDLLPPDRQLLEHYILWPDLRATWLRANIRSVPSAEVESFILKYGTLRPARELRYRYALNFVHSGDLAAYLDIYQQFYQGQDVARLDCLALQAELEAGHEQRVTLRAIDLWKVGKSQVSECDPVFKFLSERNLLGVIEYRDRYELAIENREFTLAHWLGEKIGPTHTEMAAQWQKIQAHPEAFLRSKIRQADSDTLREQLVYASKKLTYRDPTIAQKLWRRVAKKYSFTEVQKLLTAQHIALWTARDNLSGAYDLLQKLPLAAQSDEVLRWRARVSLRNSHWNKLLSDIALMSNAERKTEEWRYWQAVALQQLGRVLAAKTDLEKLSRERSYYGFLAADILGTKYALDHSELLADEVKIAAIAARPAIIRARELFYVGQDGRGRSEWDALFRYMSDDEKIQAAILANRWGWHSRAIVAVTNLGEFDDLALRYPLPYKDIFEQFSSQASIASTWAYGIARSESLFMRDIRSNAGAIGLMQLLPSTGRKVAQAIRMQYSGLATLTDPESNIRLGTTYLGQMAERYNGNQVLATAAYNAGPHRVDRWLPKDGTIDARIWIENIPFNETRKYVKRVLAAQAIFHWRLTGQLRRISDALDQIRAQPEQMVAK